MSEDLYPDNARQLISAILDRLIPANEDLSSAGQMGLEDEVLRLARKQHRFHRRFTRALNKFYSTSPNFTSESAEFQDEILRSFETDHPSSFRTLLDITYIVYYKDSRVHKRLGWENRPPQPGGYPMAPWDESVLKNIRNRKPFWRKV